MLLLLVAVLSTAPSDPVDGDLFVFEADIREVGSEPWMAGVSVVFTSADYFIGITRDHRAEDLGIASLIGSGPVDLDAYRLIHLMPGRDRPSGLPGEPVLERGTILLVRLEEPAADPVLIEGTRFVQPLRVRIAREADLPAPLQGPADGYIEDIVASVSEANLAANIQHLQDYETRLCISPEYDMATAWADDWLSDHWIPTEQQPFFFYGDSMNNVIGEIQGQLDPDRIYIICGHLDSIVWPMAPAPGADDNGSGSAAVLEAARVLGPYNFNYTIRFVLFGAEEVGLVGSEVYASQAYGAGEDIQGVVNLDMILYAPPGRDTLWIPYDDNSQALAEYAGTVMQQYVPALGTEIVYDPSATYSDHASFWEFGYPAILGIEHDVDFNPYYHQSTDLLENYLSYFPFGTNCTRAAIAVIASLAEPIGPSGAGGGGQQPVSLRVWPNPCTDVLTVELASPAGASVSLFDLSGREVLASGMTPGQSLELDLSGLPGGMYTIVCSTASSSFSSRFVRL
jgi:hypothetical protein